jgi:hypothetical protein
VKLFPVEIFSVWSFENVSFYRICWSSRSEIGCMVARWLADGVCWSGWVDGGSYYFLVVRVACTLKVRQMRRLKIRKLAGH